VIISYLAGELRWGLEHAPEPYAVLNACRALIYLADGEIVSKVAGGLAALDRGLGPAVVIRRALDQQQGRAPGQQPDLAAARFVLATAAALTEAAEAG
jgi:streptomycin 3"-adenylyltransferase